MNEKDIDFQLELRGGKLHTEYKYEGIGKGMWVETFVRHIHRDDKAIKDILQLKHGSDHIVLTPYSLQNLVDYAREHGIKIK